MWNQKDLDLFVDLKNICWIPVLFFCRATEKEIVLFQQTSNTQTYKCAANCILDRMGALDYMWLLCLQYVCYLLNHVFNNTIHGVPLQMLTGITVHISPLLQFHFFQKVFYKKVGSHFPSDSVEQDGISEHCDHALTYKVLTINTLKVIYHSLIWPATSCDPCVLSCLVGRVLAYHNPKQKFHLPA
jgi:hypothetical protein